jgi:hypothetical protein
MRVAALYAIYGNLPALRAVLADAAREPVDASVIGGDLALGPASQPAGHSRSPARIEAVSRFCEGARGHCQVLS